jgi:putative membrane protein
MIARFSSYRPNLFLLATLLLIFLWSGIEPADRFTWFLEVLPAVIGVIVLMATIRRFPLTGLLYLLIWLHAVILFVGGHYTYAEVPLFNWLRDSFDLQRNYYDRVGHFAQGFVPAMIAREILLRTSPLQPGKWLFFIVTCICLAISAGYEFVEWWVAVGTGSAAEAFLGTQGDVWDTQWDMFLAFCGAIVAQLTLTGVHSRQLDKLLRTIR